MAWKLTNSNVREPLKHFTSFSSNMALPRYDSSEIIRDHIEMRFKEALRNGLLGEKFQGADLVKCGSVFTVRTPDWTHPQGSTHIPQSSYWHVDYSGDNMFPNLAELLDSFLDHNIFFRRFGWEKIYEYEKFKKEHNLEKRVLLGVRNLWSPYHEGDSTTKKHLQMLPVDIESLLTIATGRKTPVPFCKGDGMFEKMANSGVSNVFIGLTDVSTREQNYFLTTDYLSNDLASNEGTTKWHVFDPSNFHRGQKGNIPQHKNFSIELRCGIWGEVSKP